MEKLSGILDNVKERITNPLFFSFIVSWIFFNWRIFVTLFWYDSPSNTEDNLSLVDFIERNLNSVNSFWYPFAFAVGYTLFTPILKNMIAAFQAWNLKWGDRLNLRILENSIVPMEKYLKLRRSLEQKSTELQDIILKEKSTLNDLQSANSNLLNSQNQNMELQRQLNEAKGIINDFNKIDLFQGQWLRTTRNGDKVARESIEVTNNNVYVFNGNMREQRYSVHNFRFNPSDKQVTFTFFHNGSSSPQGFFAFDELTLRHGNLSGREYGTGYHVDVIYSREDFEEDTFDDHDDNSEIFDRNYWQKKASPATLQIVDELMELIGNLLIGVALKYKKYYIGVDQNGSISNFVVFRPKRNYTRVELRIPKSSLIDELIEGAGIETMDYKESSSRYRLRLSKGDVKKYESTLRKLLVVAAAD